MHTIYLLLGGNIGNRVEALAEAKRLIHIYIGDVQQTSKIYGSEAWGYEDQPDFLNQVVIAKTLFPPEEVLVKCKSIEAEIGREKKEHWGPRVIDVDILFYGDLVLESETLTIPHKELHNRNFTLVPLLELAPTLIHPSLKEDIITLYSNSKDEGEVYEWQEEKEEGRSKIVYYYDALCGWCYGFSSVISKLRLKYKNEFDFEIISGGLFIANNGRVNEVAPHIKSGAYKNVEQATGVKFGGVFLDDIYGEGEMILDSLYPAIALSIVKDKFPHKAFNFAKTLLQAVYHDGMSSDDIDAYCVHAEHIG